MDSDEWDCGGATGAETSPESDAVDTGTAHSARIYDYIIGGKDHFPRDADIAMYGAVAHKPRTGRQD
ncbi:SAM-dependent methyltransferase [Streptomyces sp. NPDC102259]|uniref:SAM-dependent methyltransferase n=1 Tax=Streptomyces sp. NPDC102259 TaxID=3366148 RepID=UPI0038140383